MKTELQITKYLSKHLNRLFLFKHHQRVSLVKKMNWFRNGKRMQNSFNNIFSNIALNLKIPELQAGNDFYKKNKKIIQL